MPTTYMYNDDMMLRTNGDISLYMNTPDKISELQDFGKKVMFMEGGLNGNNGHNEGGFIRARNKVSYRFGFSEVPDGASQVGGRVMFTFAHDDEEEFWHSRMILDPRFQFRVNTFNDAFAPETYIAFGSANTGSGAGHQGEGGIYTHVSLVTHENPYNSSDYKNKTNRVLGFTWTSGFTYVGDDLLYKPSIGKSNVLYGDGSVKAEHVSWLFVNRIELLVTSKKAVQ